MKRFFRVSSILILFSLVLFFVCGCTARTAPGHAARDYVRDPNLNAPGTLPLVRDRVPLKIGVAQSAVIEDWNTNTMTRQLSEMTNVDLSFEVYPAGAEFTQRVELMIMAGGSDLPDALWGTFNLGNLVRYAEAGVIIPLDMYYENSAHYYNLALPNFDVDIGRYITSYDGHKYALPRLIVQIGNEYSSNHISIYRLWLNNLNLSMPDTIEDFETVLRAFRDGDPNGNGRQDEIPLIAQTATATVNLLRYLMNPFIYTQANYWIMNNGRIDVAFNKPAWREGLRYAHSLLSQGLISPLSFTQNETQMTAMIMGTPDIIGAFARISATNIPDGHPKRTYYSNNPPLRGPGGTNAFWNPTLPQAGMIITKNCQNPEVAFMFGDLLLREDISVWNRFGVRNVNWRDAGPGDYSHMERLGFPAKFSLIQGMNLWGIIQNQIFAQNGPFLIPGVWPNGMAYNPAEQPANFIPGGIFLEPFVRAGNPNPIIGLLYNNEEQQVMDEFHSTIMDYVHESYARFVMGDLSIDRDWDSYVAEFNRMGLNEVIRVTQSCWDRMNR